MKRLIYQLKEGLGNMDVTSWVIIGCIGVGLLIIYLNRRIPVVKRLVESAVIEAERNFNSGEGQLKLEYAVNSIKLRLPFVLRFLVTKSVIVTLIESTLNRISNTFDLDIEVDIKGNDGTKIHTKIDLNIGDTEVNTIYMDTPKDKLNKGETEVYGGVKVTTDWKDKPKSSVEVGLRKKI